MVSKVLRVSLVHKALLEFKARQVPRALPVLLVQLVHRALQALKARRESKD